VREIREAERNVRGGKEREREKSMDERKMRKFKKLAGMTGQRVEREGRGGYGTGHCTTITLWFSEKSFIWLNYTY